MLRISGGREAHAHRCAVAWTRLKQGVAWTRAHASRVAAACAAIGVGLAFAHDASARTADTERDADAIADLVEGYLQAQEYAANAVASVSPFGIGLFPSSMTSSPLSGGVAPMGVINPGGLAGGALPGLTNYLQQFLVGGNYQRCGLLGDGTLLGGECLTISRANFRYAFTGAALFGADLVVAPNAVDLNGNRPADHTTIIGRATSGSYLTVTNAQYSSQLNNATCSLGGVVGACIPGVVGTYTWSTLPAQDFQIIIGDGAAANGSNTVVLGTNASHTLPTAAWTGTGAPDGNYAARLGNAVVIGHGASGNADRQTILGMGASSTHANSVALGAGSVTDRGALTSYTPGGTTLVRSLAGSVAVGAAGATRQITHLAAGRDATDAVNVEQLQGAITQVNAVNALAVGYDTTARTSITLAGGATGTTIANLAPGAVTPASTQAINGAQLSGVSTSVAAGLGGGAAVAASGAVTAPTYSLQGATVIANDVGTAVTNLDGRTTSNTTTLTNLAAGTAGLVRQDPGTLAVSVAGTTGGAAVSFANASGDARTLSGVAAGTLSAGGTQGVSTGQLFNTGTTVATRLGGGAALAADGTITAPAYSLQGGAVTATDVGTAVANLDLRTTTNTASITTNTANVDALLAGTAGLVRQAAPGATLTAGAQTAGSAVDFTNNAGTARTLAGVAAGAVTAGSTDAVNGAQLFGANSALAAHLGSGATVDPGGVVTAPTYSIGGVGYANVGGAFDAVDDALAEATAVGLFAVRYDDDGAGAPNLARVTLGDRSLGPTTLANVAAGIAADEAVNVAQLAPAVAALGGGAGLDPASGAFEAPTYTLDSGSGQPVSFDNVGSALGNLDGRVQGNTTTVNSLVAGTAGLVRQAGPVAALTVGAQTGGTLADFRNADGVSRTLDGVAPGALGAASLQAVNGAQLYGLGTGIATHLGGGAAFGAGGVLAAPAYTIRGQTYLNVGSAFAAVDNAFAEIVGAPGNPVDPGVLAVTYNVDGDGDPDYSRVALRGTSGTAIGNLAAGVNALDAVNVGQLSPLVDALGGGAAIDPVTGVVAAPTYTLRDANGAPVDYGNVGDAFVNLDGRIVANATAIAQLDAGGASQYFRVNSDGAPALAFREDAVAIGESALAFGARSVAIGAGAVAGDSDDDTRVDMVAIGVNARATAQNSAAVGGGAVASGPQATALGSNAQATGSNSLALGRNAAANNAATAVGMNAVASATRATAVGQGARATETDTVALGQFAVASGENSVALGTASTATRANTVSVGTSTAQRQVVNVADGDQDTDAVNLRQLRVVENQVAALDTAAVQYDDGTQARLTLAGAGGTTIANVAAGAVAAGSNEAVTGGQVFDVAGSVAARLGGGAAVGVDGTLTAPAYAVGGSSYGDVGSAFAAVNLALGDAVAIGAAAVRYDDDGTGAPNFARITFGNGATGATTLANVAAGVASDEAVNVGQLTPLVASLGGGAAIDPVTGAVTAPTYVLDDGSNTGTNVTAVNVGEAVVNLDSRTKLNTQGINGLLAGTAGIVQQDPGSLVIRIGGQTAGDEVNVASLSGDARRVSGVANAVDTDDAVNLGQLAAAGTSMAAHLGGGAAVAADGSVTAPSYAVRGGTFDNVGAAFTAMDAAFDSVGEGVDELAALAVRYDTDGAGDPVLTRISLAGAGGTVIGNLAAGTVAAGSTEAVNGGQLFDVAGTTAAHLGGGASVDASGAINAPTYQIAGATYRNVGDAFGAVDTALGDAVAIGAFAVRYADDGTGAPDLSRIVLAGPAGTRLENVAAGVVSGDAVNVGQLAPLVDALGGGAAIDPATGAVTGPTYVLDDGSGTPIAVGGVGAAVANLDGRTVTNTAAIAGLIAGSEGLVRQDPDALVLSIGGQTGGTQASLFNSAGAARRLSGVAAGSDDTDAVNMAQMRSAITEINSDSVFAVRYDDVGGAPDFARLTFAGTGGTVLANLADGLLASGSSEAITGGQLFSTHSAIAQLLGGGAGVAVDGSFVAPRYLVQGAFYSTIGEALAALNDGLDEVGSLIGDPPPGGGGSDRLVGIDGPRDGSGDASVTEGSRGLALGATATSDGDRAVAVGSDSAATADRATAVGGNARAQAANGTALGANASIAAGAENAVAVGEGATVAAGGGTAVGQGTSVSAGNAVALGQGSVADRVSTVSVGTVGGERQITNVAAGTAATDAVNVSQLNAGLERATQSANAYTDQRLGQMQSDIWDVDRGYRAGVASAMAVAGLPQAYQPGRSMIAAAVSGYEQEAGVAVGITTVSDSGRWVYKFSGTTNTRNDVGITMGAGLQW
ncbi:YadA-like family protein [Luteimonas sp. WGS1318]|uniref:YadA-like family protein n=1 Tax=Luteimonas sp. WGS1318 TaxID=3366815 RepID=UPI00372D7D9B